MTKTNSFRNFLKKTYLTQLYRQPHNNIYSFHHVSDAPEMQLSGRKIDTKSFEDFVISHGPYVPVKDILSRTRFDSTSALTFDDGLEDVYSIAYAFLKEKGMPFTIFVLADKIGKKGYVTKEQLLEMASDPLVTIGSHGCMHVKLGEMEAAGQYTELSRSKNIIEELTGKPCEYIAYPFGSYNEDTIVTAKRLGYKKGFAVKGRPLVKGVPCRPFEIPRMSIDETTMDYYWGSV